MNEEVNIGLEDAEKLSEGVNIRDGEEVSIEVIISDSLFLGMKEIELHAWTSGWDKMFMEESVLWDVANGTCSGVDDKAKDFGVCCKWRIIVASR